MIAHMNDTTWENQGFHQKVERTDPMLTSINNSDNVSIRPTDCTLVIINFKHRHFLTTFAHSFMPLPARELALTKYLGEPLVKARAYLL